MACAWPSAGFRWNWEPGSASPCSVPTVGQDYAALKIAGAARAPSRGKISFYAGATELSPDAVKVRVGMVAHHTLVYDELTAEENLVFFAKLFRLAKRH